VSRAESASVYLAVFGLLDEFRLTSVSSGITVLVCFAERTDGGVCEGNATDVLAPRGSTRCFDVS